MCHTCPARVSSPQKDMARSLITEALLSSLPPALSQRDRQSISASLPLSATATRVGSLPSRQLLDRWALR